MLGRDVMRAAGSDARGLARAEVDVCDARAARAAVAAAKPEVVVNCAAYADVDGAEAEEAAAHAVNATGAGNVARAAAEVGAAVVHVSTDYVFTGDAARPYVESDATAPLGAYGRTKLAGEQAVLAANPRAHVVRSSWLFGAGGPNFVATMLRLAGERDELTVVDDQRGCPTYTGHLARALLEIAASDAFGLWHVAGAGACTWHELAAATFARAERAVHLHRGTTAALGRPAPRPAWSVLGTERADAVRLPAWEDGLDAYLAETGALVG